MLRVAFALLVVGCRDQEPVALPQPPEPVALDAAIDAVTDAVPGDTMRIDAPVPQDARPIDNPVAPVDAPAPIDATVIDAGKKLGTHDEVCRTADGRPNPLDRGRKVLDCEPGLSCCYPCGISGCSWVCHTAAECAYDMKRQ